MDCTRSIRDIASSFAVTFMPARRATLPMLCVQVVGTAAEPALDVPGRRVGVVCEQPFGGAPRLDDERLVEQRVGEPEQRRARLARAEELARAADREVAARDLEAVVGLE